jgi:hypothetical protein
MRDIEKSRARVMAAGGVAELLDAAWGGFTVLLAWCRGCEERAAGLFAAFAFAAAPAAQGRLVIGSAPSLPAGRGSDVGPDVSVQHDLEEVADGLAGLAGALRDRLASAAADAADPGDQEACEEEEEAAAAAAQVCGLLSRDGR